MDDKYEKIDEDTVKVTKVLPTPPPEETVVSLTAIREEHQRLTREIAGVDDYAEAEKNVRKARIKEIDSILAKAETLDTPT